MIANFRLPIANLQPVIRAKVAINMEKARIGNDLNRSEIGNRQ